MLKQEFLDALRKKLSMLPTQDVEERIDFYSEMIDDRIEEGFTEEEAILQIGQVDGISEQIISDIPLTKIAKERMKPKRKLRAWEIVFLVLGAPIWLSLIVAAFAVILAIYAVLWTLIVSLWAVFGALIGCSIGGILYVILLICTSEVFVGISIFAAVLVCSGLSILLFLGSKAATEGVLLLTKKIALSIKKSFAGGKKE